MTAKEMFEALGYVLVKDGYVNYITYKNNEFEKTIEFNKKAKNYYSPSCSSFYIEEHKAIHQQVIELGWLE